MDAPGGDFREILYTVDSEGRRRWVYPGVERGRFFRYRQPVALLLTALFLVLPWISIGGKPAMLFDIAGRKFTFFGTTFWATDTLYLAFVLGGLGISLFLFTAVMGRVWCGWACPETVFLEFLFRPVERWIEGSPGARRRLDNSPWSWRKVAIKGAKYLSFAVISWILAAAALAYFLGRDYTLEVLFSPPSLHPVYHAVMIILVALLLFQFGWFREQLCTALCPYARFQSVLLDRDSLVVAYDTGRGEPRASLRRRGEGAGDCIDCGFCVRVCPTGVDIRNGLQLECIHCAACVDACDSMMGRVGFRRGLVRYDTGSGLSGGVRRFLRPRVVIYALILAGYASALVYALSARALSEFKIFRVPGSAPFEIMSDGRIVNALQVHISNKSDQIRRYAVNVEGEGIQSITPLRAFPVKPGELGMLPVFITFPSSVMVDGRAEARVVVLDDDGYRAGREITLIGPEE